VTTGVQRPPHRLPQRPRLTARGYAGRGQGRASYVEVPREWRGTTVQVCGLFPFTVGSGAPTVGTPLGRHLVTGESVTFDPLSWFRRGNLISNPSALLIGLPALGKSTAARRLVIGAAGAGAVPMVLGDTKGEHTPVVQALGGQVVRIGRGAGSLNVLDAGAMDDVARRVGGTPGQALREEAHGRRLALLRALVAVMRGSRTLDVEDTVLSARCGCWPTGGSGARPPLSSPTS
jgi:hypothetical protein